MKPATPQGTPIEVLLVEDNPGDVRLTKEAFSEGHIHNEINVARNGKDALDFLHQEGEFEDAPRPDLILLDLNLPKKNGEQVLAEIKNDEQLRRIPVIVLTSSQAEEDILKSYDLYTNAYLTKPVNPDEFVRLVRSFEEFWLSLVKLPPV